MEFRGKQRFSRIRDRGLARNDGFLMGDAQLGPGKFGSGLVLDGSGDYLSIPRFRGIFDEGNFSISAWVLPGNLGLTNNSDDGGILCSDSNGANTVLFWYNVNGSGTGNRTYTFNVGDTGIGLNRLDGPDGLAEEGRWQHLVAVMSGQQRSIYQNGLLVAQASGSDNLVTVEGSGVRLGSWNNTTDLDFEGNLDEVRLYNRSFGLADVGILYGNGNGDLGLTPIFTVDSNHSAATVQVRVDFKKFGIAQPISDFLEGDLSVLGGTVSNFSADANGATFELSPDRFPARPTISLADGAVRSGVSESVAVSHSFSHKPSLVAEADLVTWYAFEEVNASSIVKDLSGSENHGQVTGGAMVAGKFGQSLQMDENANLTAEGDWLSLTEPFTLSLWFKVLDDSQGILARNGQFSLQYNDDATLRGLVRTNNGWGETKARMPSGEWSHVGLLRWKDPPFSERFIG